MNAQQSGKYELLDKIAEEFAERFRRGEHPALHEYTERYPELADDIRELFPAMVEIERVEAGGAAPSVPLRQVADYRIIREIGRGGMGVVYEAEQASLGRRVALKVLSIHNHGDAKSLERFKREARAAARLHHTNIVPVFEVGQDGEHCYYAMQYIQGQGLDQIVHELRQLRSASRHPAPSKGEPHADGKQDAGDGEHGPDDSRAADLAESLLTGRFVAHDVTAATVLAGPPPPLPAEPAEAGVTTSAVLPGQTELSSVESNHRHYFESIARIGRQTASALAHAHERGIIHRDVKPSNLLLDAGGTVWITDFGLAKTEEDALTRTGDILGTIRYMSPERFNGKCDPRADIYALGMTLYELLALRPAFECRDRMTLISQISADEPERLRKIDPRIPLDLETIVLKAVAKDPERRYQTANEMGQDLRRFLEGEPIKARRTSLLGRARLWSRRHPALAGLYVMLLLFGIGSAAAAVSLFGLYHKSELNRQEKEAAEERAIEDLYNSYVAQANASRFSRQVGQRLDTLEAVRKAADLVRERGMPKERLNDLRNLAISALALPDLRTLKTWERPPGDSSSWAIDDQSRLYARWQPDEGIALCRLESDEIIAKLQDGRDLRFSPGGRFLVAIGNNQFRAWDISGMEPRLVHKGVEFGFAFHPNGRHLLMGSRDGSLWFYDLEAPNQKPTLLVTLQPPIGSGLAFDPTGARLAVIRGGKAQILDAGTGKVLTPIPLDKATETPAWHPSGNYLALVSPEGHDAVIHVWDLKRRKKTATLKGCRGTVIHAAFTPDGDRILTQGWENMVRLWDWRTGRQILQTPAGCNLEFTPGGQFLTRDEAGVHLSELAPGREYRTFVAQSAVGNDVEHHVPRVHPEGRIFAATMSDCIRLFDLETGDELARVPQTKFYPAFQANGALLTNGDRGLLRWPIHEAEPGNRQLGPPEVLDVRSGVDMATDKNGDVIGQAMGNGALLVRPGKGTAFLGPHGGAQHVAISPDGSLAATGINGGEEGVKVWDTKTRRLVKHFHVGSRTGGAFSPDGSGLAVGGSLGCRMVKVGTWETLFTGLWGNVCFSPDGAIMATESTRQGLTRLVDMQTGRELARLEGPSRTWGISEFTPDGTKLLICDNYEKCINVWDLRAIREQLAKMDLDWEAPEYPKADTTPKSPYRVTVVPGNLFVDPRRTVGLAGVRLALNPFDIEAYIERGRGYARLSDSKKAIADYSMALAILPADHPIRGELLFRRSTNYAALGDPAKRVADLLEFAALDMPFPVELQSEAARQCNELAWLTYLIGSKQQRDPKKGLTLALKATKLDPECWELLNTLGVAYYRNGDYAKAVETLQRSLDQSREMAAAFDLFFLAMCRHRLGDAKKAQEEYDEAVRWFNEHRGKLPYPDSERELTEFQAEAKAVLAEPVGEPKGITP
jgi:serine/threonine protein kinase/WD40 repeat protein